jgi:hypothetical protein
VYGGHFREARHFRGQNSKNLGYVAKVGLLVVVTVALISLLDPRARGKRGK